MTRHTPLYMQAAGADAEPEYSAVLDRRIFTGIWNGPGLLNTNGSDLLVSQRAAGANFTVDVNEGMAVIEGTDVADQGFYMVWSDATENVPIPAPPVSGTRIHLIVARIKDKLHEGTWPDGTYEWTLECIDDPDGSGPPATPDSAIPLAEVTVTSSTTSITAANIADASSQAVSTAGVAKWAASDAARPANPTDGQRIWRSDKLCEEIASGGSWYEIARRDGGGSAWTTYTPALTATTTNPNMGASPSRTGRYVREGRKVTVEVVLKFGSSGVSAGSGFYEISLPVAARTQSPGRQALGSAYTWDNSGSDFADGIVFLDTGVGDKVRLSIDSTVVANNWPMTWAINDELGFTATYEAAS